MYSFEYIVDIIDHGDVRSTKRIYGIVMAESDAEGLRQIGEYYDDSIVRMVYFGCSDEGAIYELNATYANEFKVSGRRFGKIIPPLVDYPEPENQ